MILFMASSSYCFYLISISVIKFSNYEVTVSTTKEIETPINFPAVTICNLNPFVKTRATKFINNALQTVNLKIGADEQAVGFISKILDILKKDAAANPITAFNSSYQKDIGYDIDEILVSCYYSGQKCSSSDFKFIRSYDYGNCYTFNANLSNIRNISNAGPQHGLELELFTGLDDIYIYKRGFYVVVHNQSVSPIMDNEGVYVSIGAETNIGIERVFYEKLSSPYSKCVENPNSPDSSTSALYKAILNELGEKTYRQKYCFKLCYQLLVMNSCTCFDPKYSKPYKNESIRPCFSNIEVDCMNKQETDFEDTNLKDTCGKDCPQDCLQINYITNVNTATYPTDVYLQYLLQTNFFKNNTNKTSSIAKVNIFYNEISYSLFKEYPSKTIDGLMGEIGGQLGLFIGISLLSLFELFELLFEIIRISFLNKKNNKITIK